jgi:hypothetical protein
MVAEQFEDQIRKLIRARPFRPFVVVMVDGRSVHVNKPKAAINSGGAGLVDCHGEIHLLECEQVREMRPSHEELAK